MQDCDLGHSSGIVMCAISSLLRYYSNPGVVQDINSRVIFSMIKFQWFKNIDEDLKLVIKKIITLITVWLNE